MTPFGCIWGVFNIRTPESCTILAGETSWDGVDLRGGTKGLFPTSTPHPLSQAGARVTVPRLPSGAFDCSCHSAMPLVLRFALSGFYPPRFVFVAGCGWRLWSVFVFWRSGASALTGVSFVFCFGGSAPSVLLLFLLAAAVDFCPLMLLLLVFLFWCPVASACPGVSFFWWLCLVFVVWRSGLSGASARPGVFVFFPEWLWFVFGVCLLAFWGFCSPGVSFVFFCFGGFASSAAAPFVLFLFLLAAAVDFCPLMLVAAVGVFLLAPCGFCPPWGVFFWWLCLVFVLWCSGLPGASAGPGLSPFVFVVVIGVSFLGLWGFCSPWGVRLLPLGGCVGVCLLALWSFCLLCCVSLPLGGCRWHGSYGHSAACADGWCCVLRFGVCLPSGLGRFVCLLLPCGAVFDSPSFFLFCWLVCGALGLPPARAVPVAFVG